jgi:hypothetical protein
VRLGLQKSAKADGFPMHIPHIPGRRSKIRFSSGDGFGNPRLPQHIRAFPDINVFLNAHLAPEANAVCNSGFATNANLRGNQAIFANYHPMTQMDLVVQFGAFAQDGIARNTFVNGTGSAYFNRVVNDDPSAA